MSLLRGSLLAVASCCLSFGVYLVWKKADNLRPQKYLGAEYVTVRVRLWPRAEAEKEAFTERFDLHPMVMIHHGFFS